MLNIWTAKRRSFTCYSIVELKHIFANTDIPTDIESYSNSENKQYRWTNNLRNNLRKKRRVQKEDQRCSVKKFYFAIFTRKHKKRLQHRCILVNIAKFLRTAISKNICEQLLVCGVCMCSYSSTVKASSDCKTSETYLEGTDRQCYVEYHSRCFCQVSSSSFLKMSYISPPSTKTPASTNWKENSMIYGSAKRSYILI